MPDPDFASFLVSYDRSAAILSLEQAERKRREILALFPRETLASLPLERYAPGEDVEGPVLAGLLARGSTALGGDVRGAAFNQVRLHKVKGQDRYNSLFKDEPDPQKAWAALRAAFIRCCELADEGKWDEIDGVAPANWIPAIRTKLLHVYFPGEVLPVFVSGEMGHFLKALDIGFAPGKGKYTAAPNRRLLEHLRTIPALDGWSPLEMAAALRAWRPLPMKSPGEDLILRIAPGDNAKFWDECLEEGYICVGWDELPDLKQFATEKQLRDKFEEIYKPDEDTSGKRATRTRQAGMLWRYLNFRPGDLVVANKGMGEVLAVGTVIEPGYRWLDDRAEYKHVVQVDWDTGFARKLPSNQSDWRPTMTFLNEAQRKMIFDTESPVSVSPPSMTPAVSAALNRILYGPPGTGKTYSVIREAARIVSGGSFADDDAARAAYDEACASGRIRFATFHQSFGYEDFIEGIRPVMDEGGEARFRVRDGIFKEIADEALFACFERTSDDLTGDFEAHWNALIAAISQTGQLSIPGLAKVDWTLSETDQGNVEAINNETGKRFYCGKTALAAIWSKAYPADQITSTQSQEALGRSAHHHVVAAVYNYIRKLSPETGTSAAIVPNTDHASSVRAFLQLGEKSGWRLSKKPFPPYVLVIDEINRGNISRIFGELITLIEDDKRCGEANALHVTLPASRDRFAVPPNLFLLGTMNTADKSLALLDTALRRRFEFTELAPDFAACKGLPPEMQAILGILNARIELRKDRDHRIGHAFFMNVTDAAGFNRVFTRKVVPLLQEYFFNDIDGARFVLGETGRENDGAGFLRELPKSGEDAPWQRNRWRWFTDVDPHMDCWARLRETLGFPS